MTTKTLKKETGKTLSKTTKESLLITSVRNSKKLSKEVSISMEHKSPHHSHPDYSDQLKRLSRIKGQLEGIERMIQDRRYCPDIIVQLKAASAAIKTVESQIFKTHLQNCVNSAFHGEDKFSADRKIQEILKLLY